MPDTKAMSALVSEAARAIGPDFSAYTERDGGPWYLIAGHRESWHGASRVADTDTEDRDTARASIREFWRVEAESEEAACGKIEEGSGDAEFLFDETLGDEDERAVDTVHPGDTLDGQLFRRKVEAAAPAMLAALEKLLMRWGDYLHFAESAGEPRDGAYLEQAREYEAQARAAIAQARGGEA